MSISDFRRKILCSKGLAGSAHKNGRQLWSWKYFKFYPSLVRIGDEVCSDHGLSTAAYADSLSEFGVPHELPKSGGWILERKIADTRYADGAVVIPCFVVRPGQGCKRIWINWAKILSHCPSSLIHSANMMNSISESVLQMS